MKTGWCWQLGLLLIILLTIDACTEVDVCEEVDHPHYSSVSFNYDWNKYGVNPPDSLYVIAYRVINMWKSAITIDRLTQTGHYIDNSPVAALVDSTGIGTFKIPGGEYKFITFNQSNMELVYNRVVLFSQSPTMSLNDLEVTYRTYTKDDPLLKKPILDWADYNPYSRFMQPNTSAICFDTIATTKFHVNEVKKVTFAPHPVTQDVEIYFNIEKIVKTNNFTVDSVYGEISGVPFTINLSTGYIDIRRTCKMMFTCELQSSDGKPMKADTETNSKLRCKGVVCVPTIVKNSGPKIYSGPGIMQVVICCSAINPEYPAYSSYPRIRKKFQGLINLYNTLTAAKIYQYTPDGQHVLQNGQKKELHIDSKMQVDGKSILESSDDIGGVDLWKSTMNDSIIVDI